MHKTDSGFYVIDVLPLHHASKRPFHLEKRMKTKRSGSSYDASKLLLCTPDEAQLKRAAILEARRVKLARQFMHVKDVLSKQHQRAIRDSSAKRSRIQKTLLVAEKNRNGIMQKLVEQCAQEVARCKEVARQQQRKNKEAMDRRRADLERRQRATAARRARLLSVPKSRIFSTDVAAPSRDEAAALIQRWWRYYAYLPLVKNFRKFAISVHTTESGSFQNTVALLRKSGVIQATGKLLQHVRKASASTSGPNKYKNPARVFLSSYMIVSHTDEILVESGRLETALRNSAEDMLKAFETWVNEMERGAPNKTQSASLLSFLQTWDTYYNKFNNWKSKDSEKLANNLIAHYLDLENLWLTVKNQANAETEWRPSILLQQQETRQKICKLAGEEAIAKLERAVKRLKEDAPSDQEDNVNVSDSVAGGSSEPGNVDKYADKNDSVPPPRQPFVQAALAASGVATSETDPVSPRQSASARLPADSSTKSFDRDVKQESANANDNLRRIIQSFGPQRVSNLTNEQLAHEIIIDPDFELKPSPRSELEEQVRRTVTKACFDAVRSDFEQRRYDKWIPTFMEDIRGALLELVPPSSSLSITIKEALDIDLIKQQTKANVYDIRNAILFVTNTMLQICAPVRDEEIHALKSVNDLTEIFQRLLDILDQMKLDLVNYRVKVLRPYLKDQAVEYEQTKFGDALKEKRVTLDHTRAWMNPITDQLLRTVAERNPENVALPQHRHNHGLKFDQVYNEALVSYVFQIAAIDPTNCPETFLLDVQRLRSFQNEGQMITIATALLMLTKNVANGNGISNVNDETLVTLKERLFVLLAGDTTLDNLTAEIVSHLPSLPAENRALIGSMATKIISQSDKVYSLLSRRIQNVVKQHLQSGNFPKHENLAQYGLFPAAKELEQLSRKIVMLGKYNREVYAKWYDAVIRERLNEITAERQKDSC